LSETIKDEIMANQRFDRWKSSYGKVLRKSILIMWWSKRRNKNTITAEFFKRMNFPSYPRHLYDYGEKW